MCDCNKGCDAMRPDRIIPPRAGIDTALPVYGNGFGNPLIGNPRSEPGKEPLPPRSPTAIPPPATGPATGVGASLATSSTPVDVVALAKKHWPWLIVGGLVVAVFVVK